VKVTAPLIALLFLTGCKFMLEQPSGPYQKPKLSAPLEKNRQTFTGKVVLDDGAYRLQLLDESGTLLRLTRARRESGFEKEQILLRKYYEKTITVLGTRQDDWIWGADITGQYVPPGGPTGPNMNAPKQTRP
jgi:hypothetical protein